MKGWIARQDSSSAPTLNSACFTFCCLKTLPRMQPPHHSSYSNLKDSLLWSQHVILHFTLCQIYNYHHHHRLPLKCLPNNAFHSVLAERKILPTQLGLILMKIVFASFQLIAQWPCCMTNCHKPSSAAKELHVNMSPPTQKLGSHMKQF